MQHHDIYVHIKSQTSQRETKEKFMLILVLLEAGMSVPSYYFGIIAVCPYKE